MDNNATIDTSAGTTSPVGNVESLLGDELVKAAIEMIDERDELSISEVARRLYYSRTAIQRRAGSVQQLKSNVWNVLLLGLLEHVTRDGRDPSPRLRQHRDRVRGWVSLHSSRFDFLVNHMPQEVYLDLVHMAIVSARLGRNRQSILQRIGRNPMAGTPPVSYPPVTTIELAEHWVRHLQNRCKFLEIYEGNVPPAIDVAFINVGSELLRIRPVPVRQLTTTLGANPG